MVSRADRTKDGFWALWYREGGGHQVSVERWIGRDCLRALIVCDVWHDEDSSVQKNGRVGESKLV